MKYIYNNRKNYESKKIENKPKTNYQLSVINIRENFLSYFEKYLLLLPKEILLLEQKNKQSIHVSEVIKEYNICWKNKAITKNSYQQYYINKDIIPNNIKLFVVVIIFIEIIELHRISNYWEHNFFIKILCLILYHKIKNLLFYHMYYIYLLLNQKKNIDNNDISIDDYS